MVNLHRLPAGARHREESVAAQEKLARQVSALFGSKWHEALLITQRSQVQILPPLLRFRRSEAVFRGCGKRPQDRLPSICHQTLPSSSVFCSADRDQTVTWVAAESRFHLRPREAR